MKKVLIVAYSFPPVGGAGVQRPTKYVKYLRRFGWEPVVLTVANPSVPTLDAELLSDIPEDVRIYRARSLEPSYSAKQRFSTATRRAGGIRSRAKSYLSMLLLPDPQVLWWPGLLGGLVKVISAEKPDCLYVTAPPFSSFIPVVVIGKLFGLPVILDYRDEWTFSRQSWENASKSRVAFFLDSLLEKFALSSCHTFVAATQSYVDSIVQRYGAQFAGKGEVITNGYDADDFPAESSRRQAGDTAPITIVYAGTVWKATSLGAFCSALARYLSLNPPVAGGIRVKVFGRVVGEEAASLESEALKEVVQCLGYVEHRKAVEEMWAADILLLTLSDLPGAEKIIHGKVFEYMASGRHLLAIIPDGEVKKLIAEQYGNATIASPTDAEGVYAAVEYVLANINELRARKGMDVSVFLRENLTGKLSRVLNKATG